MISIRVCRICGLQAYTEADLGSFVRNSHGAYGYTTLCKICQKEERKKWELSRKVFERWVGPVGKKRKEIIVNGKWVLRSRIIMEKHLGRSLRSDEIVHHVNEDTKDDRLENLKLMTYSEHARKHVVERYADPVLRVNMVPPPHLEFDKHPNWKGDSASPAAKYMRIWNRTEKGKLRIAERTRTRK